VQFLTIPGEGFPGLILGNPWGIEDASCPTQETPLDPARDNPPVPAWHAHAPFRFEAGLTQDFIGYMLPAWAFVSETGTYISTCHTDKDDKDSKGHQHKLEDEGVGPTASNAVATQLAALLDKHPDPVAHIVQGRYLYADGSTSRRPLATAADGSNQQAVAIWIAAAGASALTPGQGRILALNGVSAIGGRPANAGAVFMDYDGQPQTAPDLSTRGMLVRNADGSVAERDYLDLYPALSVTPLGKSAAVAAAPGRFGGALSFSLLLPLLLAARRRPAKRRKG
jgi:hypothetical protein